MHKFYQSPQLKPILYYGAFIAIYYFFIFVQFPFEFLGGLEPLILFVIAPLTAVFYIVKSVRIGQKKFSWQVLFGYCAVPGLMSGLLFAYGVYSVVHGEPSLFAIVPFAVAGIIGGLIAGLAGLAFKRYLR